MGYTLEDDGFLCHEGRIYVPSIGELRKAILVEVHQAPYLAHPGVKNMHANLK